MLNAEEDRRREEVWRLQTGDVIRTASDRFHQIAQLLQLDSKATAAFVSAAMEATRQYQTGYMFANYEKRTGHPYPDEGHDNEENVWAANWVAALEWLRDALPRPEAAR
jgi:hypothetical protein